MVKVVWAPTDGREALARGGVGLVVDAGDAGACGGESRGVKGEHTSSYQGLDTGAGECV